jgi:hypothetical protein
LAIDQNTAHPGSQHHRRWPRRLQLPGSLAFFSRLCAPVDWQLKSGAIFPRKARSPPIASGLRTGYRL